MNKLVIIIPAILGLAALYGYVMNIVSLFSGGADADLADVTVMTVARLIGLVAVPLGAILGYF
jgi:VanZ family protein